MHDPNPTPTDTEQRERLEAIQKEPESPYEKARDRVTKLVESGVRPRIARSMIWLGRLSVAAPGGILLCGILSLIVSTFLHGRSG